MFSRPVLFVVLLLAAAVGGCSGSDDGPSALPALPDLDLAKFPPELSRKVEPLYQSFQENPRAAAANGQLAMLLHAHGEFQTAEILYRRADFLQPDSPRWIYFLGVVQTRQGNKSDAEQSLRRTLQLDPSFHPARLRLAQLLFETEQLAESAELYGMLLKADAGNVEAHYGLGRLRAAEGKTGEAIELLGRSVLLAPNFGAAHYALALAYRDSGDEEASRRHLRIYESDRLGSPVTKDPLIAEITALKTGAPELLKRGVELEQAGDLAGAVREHLRALEADPNFDQAHTNLVILYGRTGRPEEAEKHYRASISINPNQAGLHYNFGVLAFGLKRREAALAAFRQAIEIDPRHPKAHNNLGHLLEMRGRADEAISHYRRAIDADPNYRLARYHLGRMLLSKNRNSEAIEHLVKTLTPEDEDTSEYMFTLALAYARSGERDQAKRYGSRARQLAERYQQTELMARIDRQMARFP